MPPFKQTLLSFKPPRAGDSTQTPTTSSASLQEATSSSSPTAAVPTPTSTAPSATPPTSSPLATSACAGPSIATSTSSQEDFVTAIQGHITQVLRPLAQQKFTFPNRSTLDLLNTDDRTLSVEVCKVFLPAAQDVMMELHAGRVPSELLLSGLEQVINLPEGRRSLAGLYLHAFLPSQEDGFNKTDPTRMHFYGGIGAGLNGGKNIAGVYKRVKQHHMSAQERKRSPSQHYRLAYGDLLSPADLSNGVPIASTHSFYHAMAFFRSNEQPAFISICEAVLITFCHLCFEPLYHTFYRALSLQVPTLAFDGSNSHTGLEDFSSSVTQNRDLQRSKALKSGIGERTARLKVEDPQASLRDRGKGGKNTAVAKHLKAAQKLYEEGWTCNYAHHTNSLDLPAIGVETVNAIERNMLKLDKNTLQRRLGFDFEKGAKVVVKLTFVFPAGLAPEDFFIKSVFAIGDKSAEIEIRPGDKTLIKTASLNVAQTWVARAIMLLDNHDGQSSGSDSLPSASSYSSSSSSSSSFRPEKRKLSESSMVNEPEPKKLKNQ